LRRVEAKIDQPRGREYGFGVRPRLHTSIRIVRTNQAGGALESLEQFEAYAARLRDFSRRDQHSVIANHANGRQQQGTELAADPIDIKAAREQPFNELGTFLTRSPLQILEQPECLDVRGVRV
jgi:hypothetical protein